MCFGKSFGSPEGVDSPGRARKFIGKGVFKDLAHEAERERAVDRISYRGSPLQKC